MSHKLDFYEIQLGLFCWKQLKKKQMESLLQDQVITLSSKNTTTTAHNC